MPELRYPDPPLYDDAVLLRSFIADDAPAITAICRDAEVQRWTSVPYPYDELDARDFLVRAEEARLRGEELQQAIVDGADGHLLGAIGLELSAQHLIGQIGYYLGPESRGRGNATRALRLMCGWTIRVLGLRRIEVLADPDNFASQRVARRSGFTEEGLMRSYRERKGERDDLLMFSMLPAELDPPAMRFVPLEQIQEQVAELRERYRGRLAMLLPAADVQEFGATTTPGAITKGDLDLLVRVPEEHFAAARGALRESYAVHQLDNWTESFASFHATADVGIHLVVEGSETDVLLRGSRDALIGDPALLERYNALKREHEGSDPEVYLRAKQEFFESL